MSRGIVWDTEEMPQKGDIPILKEKILRQTLVARRTVRRTQLKGAILACEVTGGS